MDSLNQDIISRYATNNQFILSYSLHHNPTDTTTLPSHLEQFKNLYKKYPEIVTADAGYGSEENYKILEDKHIEAYVKYGSFEKDQKKCKITIPTGKYAL